MATDYVSPSLAVCVAATSCGVHIAPALAMSHLSPVQAMYAARGSVVGNIPSIGVQHTLLIYEGHVNAIMRGAHQVIHVSCSVACGEGTLHMHVCEMTQPSPVFRT